MPKGGRRKTGDWRLEGERIYHRERREHEGKK